MILRGIKFEDVIQSPGTTNFNGIGWWYHHLLWPFGLNFRGSTFTSRTVTLMRKCGPQYFVADHKRLSVLSADNLSNPGIDFVLRQKWWYVIDRPFFISVAPVSTTLSGKITEIEVLCKMLSGAGKDFGRKFKAPWGIQIDISYRHAETEECETTEKTALSILEGVSKSLPEDIPVVIKLGSETKPESSIRISNHPRCDCLCFSSAIPFGSRPSWVSHVPHIPWKDLYGTDKPNESPLQRTLLGFSGKYSGRYLLPIVCEWIRAVRVLGVRKPIIGSGGVLSPEDAGHVLDAGADAVSLGSIAILRPTGITSTIRGVKNYINLEARCSNPRIENMEFNV